MIRSNRFVTPLVLPIFVALVIASATCQDVPQGLLDRLSATRNVGVQRAHRIRWAAIREISALGTASKLRIAGPLFELLKHDNRDVRRSVSLVIGTLGPGIELVLPRLVKLIPSLEGQAFVLRNCMGAISNVKRIPAEYFTFLQHYCHHKDVETRAAALSAMAAICGHAQAKLDILAEALEDPASYVVLNAISLLESLEFSGTLTLPSNRLFQLFLISLESHPTAAMVALIRAGIRSRSPKKRFICLKVIVATRMADPEILVTMRSLLKELSHGERGRSWQMVTLGELFHAADVLGPRAKSLLGAIESVYDGLKNSTIDLPMEFGYDLKRAADHIRGEVPKSYLRTVLSSQDLQTKHSVTAPSDVQKEADGSWCMFFPNFPGTVASLELFVRQDKKGEISFYGDVWVAKWIGGHWGAKVPMFDTTIALPPDFSRSKQIVATIRARGAPAYHVSFRNPLVAGEHR